MPPKMISEQDVKTQPLWHEDNGRRQQIQDRPPVANAISGHVLGDAARRLLLNSLSHRKDTHGAAYQIAQRGQQASGGILGAPSPFQHPSFQGDQPGRRSRPAGPPGYEQGFIPQGPQGYGRGYGAPQSYSQPSYPGSQQPYVSQSGYPIPSNGYYPNQPNFQSQQSHQSHHGYQHHQTVPRAPPSVGGPGFMGRGGAYPPHTQQPGPPGASSAWNGGRGVAVSTQSYSRVTQQVVTSNSFTPVQGRGRGGRHNYNSNNNTNNNNNKRY